MIRSRDDLLEHISADLHVRHLDRWHAHYRITQRICYYQWLLRRAEYWNNCRHDPLGRLVAMVLRIRLKLLGERFGFSIPLNVFGPGLSIAHIGTIVVNGNARVGARCRISQGVTIGVGANGSPRLGDDCWIGPNALILGRVDIGNEAVIRGGAVVVDDVPGRVHVAGVPARKITSNARAGTNGSRFESPLRS